MSTSPTSGGGEPPAAAVVAAPPPSVGLHGTVAMFDPSQDDWCEYIERLEHYFTANDIASSEKRRAILLNAVGAATYRLIRTLVAPAKVSEISFDNIVDRARNLKPSPIVKRFEFNTRRQKENESVAVYVAELRKIAEYCEYGRVLSDMLRDRIVCGILDRTVQRRLLQQPDLTFEKALEIALASEAADKDSKRLNLSAAPDKDLSIGKVKDGPSRTPPSHHKGDRNPKRGKPFKSEKTQQTPRVRGRGSVPGLGENTMKTTVPTRNTSVTTARKRVI